MPVRSSLPARSPLCQPGGRAGLWLGWPVSVQLQPQAPFRARELAFGPENGDASNRVGEVRDGWRAERRKEIEVVNYLVLFG